MDDPHGTYLIQRFYRDGGPQEPVDLPTGLSLEEARRHCTDPETCSSTATGPAALAHTAAHGPWFDGYTAEE